MNCAHLFNGIGGFALAAHWMGWNNVMHCEIDPFCRNDGFPGELVGITLSKWKEGSLKALGNAIVPQVAYEIFKAINHAHSHL